MSVRLSTKIGVALTALQASKPFGMTAVRARARSLREWIYRARRNRVGRTVDWQ